MQQFEALASQSLALEVHDFLHADGDDNADDADDEEQIADAFPVGRVGQPSLQAWFRKHAISA